MAINSFSFDSSHANISANKKETKMASAVASPPASAAHNAAELYKVLQALCEKYKVPVSAQSDKLNKLVAESWFADLPPLRDHPNPAEATILLEPVVRLASKEGHVVEQIQRYGRVDFFTWVYALSESGQRIFRELWVKGF
jgi:hypothetical protein